MDGKLDGRRAGSGQRQHVPPDGAARRQRAGAARASERRSRAGTAPQREQPARPVRRGQSVCPRGAQHDPDELGHRVDFAGTGEAAVAAVERGGYDVVLMDVTLPGIGRARRRCARSAPCRGAAAQVPRHRRFGPHRARRRRGRARGWHECVSGEAASARPRWRRPSRRRERPDREPMRSVLRDEHGRVVEFVVDRRQRV